jgi:hypothetical protein
VCVCGSATEKARAATNNRVMAAPWERFALLISLVIRSVAAMRSYGVWRLCPGATLPKMIQQVRESCVAPTTVDVRPATATLHATNRKFIALHRHAHGVCGMLDSKAKVICTERGSGLKKIN